MLFLYVEWFTFIGKKAEMFEPGSPFAIQFTSSVENSSSIEPLNVSVHPCWDTSLSCSCGDCPSANSCADVLPPSSHGDEGYCLIQVGHKQVEFFQRDFPLALYNIH